MQEHEHEHEPAQFEHGSDLYSDGNQQFAEMAQVPFATDALMQVVAREQQDLAEKLAILSARAGVCYMNAIVRKKERTEEGSFTAVVTITLSGTELATNDASYEEAQAKLIEGLQPFHDWAKKLQEE